MTRNAAAARAPEGPGPSERKTSAGAPPAVDERVRAVPPAEVYALLASGPDGLDEEEATRRLAQDGPNGLVHVKGPSLARRLAANFTHFMALLLWGAAVIAFVAGLPQLGIAIVLVNVVNGGFSFWQEFKAERAAEALRELLPPRAHVLRAGQVVELLAEDLVVGDVLVLEEGDRISADARLVEDVELHVDESTLTGESRPVRKRSGATTGPTAWTASPGLVFAGTSLVSGRGKAVVTATGMDTEFGRIAALTQETTQEDSPLQRELRRLSVTVGLIATGAGLVFLVVAQLFTPMGLAAGFVFTLGMIVAFVPEGLLPTVTLALALGSQRMARRNALVKRLSAVETLGCTTVVCTDKTGTLTRNEMTVRVVWTAAAELSFGGTGYDPGGTVRAGDRVLETPVTGDLHDLLVASGLASNARLVPADEDGAGRRVIGDPTEAALEVAAERAGLDLEQAARVTPRVGELPFDSVRKRMATVHATDAGERLVHVKGAVRELLERCVAVRVDGRDVPLEDGVRRRAEAANDAYSGEALRVLAVATRRLDERADAADADAVERDLTLLGLVGMLDPPHEEVAEAIVRCRRAGIRVVMMTGDYGLTAASIAKRIGLGGGRGMRIVNGAELDALDEDALDRVLEEEVLFARVTPAHKLRIVTALQRAGHVVAVTGDGVNDAPALKRADIGVAMGRAGTDVAKEAADMVLLDDNFASIINAVEEGRSVYANIRKFTGYIFTSNTPEAVPFIVFALSGGQIPLALGVMHILAIDLGTDLVPALALGAEPPERGVMDRPPRRTDEHLVTRGMLLRSYGWLGPLQAAAVMGAFLLAYWSAGFWGHPAGLPDSGPVYFSATAVALAVVVSTQIGNLFAHRTERASVAAVGWTTNRLAFAGIAVELALLFAIVYAPPLQALVGTAPFPAQLWLAVLAAAPLLLIADEARKAVLRRREGRPV